MTDEERDAARDHQARIMELVMLAEPEDILAEFVRIQVGMNALAERLGQVSLLNPEGMHLSVEEVRELTVFFVAVGKYAQMVAEVVN